MKYLITFRITEVTKQKYNKAVDVFFQILLNYLSKLLRSFIKRSDASRVVLCKVLLKAPSRDK